MAAAEEIGPHSGRHPGNFPQAFSHLALINAVMHLIQADERLSAGATISSGLDPTAGPAPAGPRRAFPAPAMTPSTRTAGSTCR